MILPPSRVGPPTPHSSPPALGPLSGRLSTYEVIEGSIRQSTAFAPPPNPPCRRALVPRSTGDYPELENTSSGRESRRPAVLCDALPRSAWTNPLGVTLPAISEPNPVYRRLRDMWSTSSTMDAPARLGVTVPALGVLRAASLLTAVVLCTVSPVGRTQLISGSIATCTNEGEPVIIPLIAFDPCISCICLKKALPVRHGRLDLASYDSDVQPSVRVAWLQ
ncbi:hypothetical protein Bbelb_244580 [Branchiostoma belcheri]|nr:hypothetical protein Bbelb_244580 [Branchiostoma belcheri]